MMMVMQFIHTHKLWMDGGWVKKKCDNSLILMLMMV